MKNLILVVFTVLCFDIKAQSIGDMPPNAEPGKCYGRCMIDSTKTFSQWEEIVCGKDIKPKLIRDVANALQSKGYKIDVFAEVMDARLKTELSKFQKENKLPIGNLNIKTLKALGISY
jgi:hypothetical protein